MSSNFLSLTNGDIDEKKYFQTLDNFIKEIQFIREQISVPETKDIVKSNFKAVIDVISIYKNPLINSILKDFAIFQAKKVLAESEDSSERIIRELRNTQSSNITRINRLNSNGSNTNTNSNRFIQENQLPEMVSDFSDDEFLRDEKNTMIKNSFDNIIKKSSMYKFFKIEKNEKKRF